LRSLKALDISKNVIFKENIETMCAAIRSGQASGLEILVMNNIEALNDEVIESFSEMLRHHPNLKQLSLVGSSFSSSSIVRILTALN
jgi:hypothetical protein